MAAYRHFLPAEGARRAPAVYDADFSTDVGASLGDRFRAGCSYAGGCEPWSSR